MPIDYFRLGLLGQIKRLAAVKTLRVEKTPSYTDLVAAERESSMGFASFLDGFLETVRAAGMAPLASASRIWLRLMVKGEINKFANEDGWSSCPIEV